MKTAALEVAVPELEWNTILSPEQIEAFHNRTAKIDPRFAKEDRDFMNARSVAELHALAAQSWLTNQKTPYVMARSYIARAMAAVSR
jgi:hypothetical protein